MSDHGESPRPRSPAVARNRDAILAVLKQEFAARTSVLEIGSGTGEHAVYFGKALPGLTWQCSDRLDNLPGIEAWLDHEPLANVRRPLTLDVDHPPPLERTYDGAFSANTAHIMSESQVAAMFRLLGGVLLTGGRFCLYGPFKIDGAFTSDSNARFDASLRAQDAEMGIRALDALDILALQANLERRALYAMPANNFIVVWERTAVAT